MERLRLSSCAQSRRVACTYAALEKTINASASHLSGSRCCNTRRISRCAMGNDTRTSTPRYAAALSTNTVYAGADVRWALSSHIPRAPRELTRIGLTMEGGYRKFIAAQMRRYDKSLGSLRPNRCNSANCSAIKASVSALLCSRGSNPRGGVPCACLRQ